MHCGMDDRIESMVKPDDMTLDCHCQNLSSPLFLDGECRKRFLTPFLTESNQCQIMLRFVWMYIV